MRGRKPKPTALKILQGNAGHRPIDTRGEPAVVLGLGEPPHYLDAVAKEFWFAQGPQLVALGTLGESDAPLFAELAALHSRNLYLSAKIAAFRRVKVLSPSAERKLDKLEAQRLKVSAQFMKTGAEFGIGAASRTRIRVKPDGEQSEFGFDGDRDDSAFAQAQRLARG
jgi:phage terminase small subunit